MTPFLLMWATYEVESRCMFTLMKSVRVLYMWAPLGRKKQLPGLTSLKKNSSWSCREIMQTWYLPLRFISFYQLCFPFPTVPMRLWSLLLASSCSLSHSCLSFSPGKATPWRRVTHQGSVSLAWVTDDSWDGPDMEWWQGERDRENNESTTERDDEGQPEKGVLQHVWWVPLCLYGKRTGNWPQTNTTSCCWYFQPRCHGIPLCPVTAQCGNSSLPTGSIKMRQIPFSHSVSRRTDRRAKYVQIKQITRPMNKNLIAQKNFCIRRKHSGKEEQMDT